MKILKRLLIGLLLLVGILLILAAIAPKELSVEKSVTIDAPLAAAFEGVNELTNWQHWSPWSELDTTIKNSYYDQTSGQGAYMTWVSEKSGAGQMTITDVYNMDSLKTALEFDGQGGAIADFHFSATEAGTKVTWDFYNKMSYPMNVMPWLFGAEKMLSGAYEKGLENLKQFVEDKYEASAALSIKKIDFPAKHFLAKRAVITFDEFGDYFQATIPAVGAAFVQNTVKMGGPVSAIIYVWDMENESADLAIGIEADPSATIDGLTGIDVAAGQALQIDYYGPYEGTGAAHEAMDTYMKANDINAEAVSVLERYITDPGSEPDPSKWLTEVIYVLGE